MPKVRESKPKVRELKPEVQEHVKLPERKTKL